LQRPHRFTQFDGVTSSEHLDVFGKLFGVRHRGTLNENRDHADVSLKRHCDLAQHPILRIILPAAPAPLTGH
jgi:hypothetical protein